MTTLSDDLPSLYDITGKITDHNTLLINRNILRQLEADTEMLDWLEASTAGHGFCHQGYGEYRYCAHQLEGYKTVRQALTTAMKGQQ